MARKSKKIEEEVKKMENSLQEARNKLEEAQKQDLDHMKEVETAIWQVVQENEMFCGVILNHEALLKLAQICHESGQDAKIPFRLYHIE